MKKTLLVLLTFISLTVFAETNLLENEKELIPVQLPENNSNLIGQIYPYHKCKAPIEISKPVALKEEDKNEESIKMYNKIVEDYNNKVDEFKKDAKEYLNCVELFVERGQNDLNTIKGNLEGAIKEANSFIQKYQK